MQVTVLEFNDFRGGGWVAIAYPGDLEEAVSASKAHGSGLYLFTRRNAYSRVVNWILVYLDGTVRDMGPGGDLVEPSLTAAEAAEEFSSTCWQVLQPAALRWKLELVFDDIDAYRALRKAVPNIPYKPRELAEALIAAAVARFGDGVIPRDGGDVAILTARIKTISEIKSFLRDFAESYLKQFIQPPEVQQWPGGNGDRAQSAELR